MIKSFADVLTEKIFKGESLSSRELRTLGNLRIGKVYERLNALDHFNERDLMMASSYHYHTLNNGRYSIDANARNLPWRITFQWENDEMTNVELVKIEDTHK